MVPSRCSRLSCRAPLNESPSEKEGKSTRLLRVSGLVFPSMKAPPKRKGNRGLGAGQVLDLAALNESPSEKEGK